MVRRANHNWCVPTSVGVNTKANVFVSPESIGASHTTVSGVIGMLYTSDFIIRKTAFSDSDRIDVNATFKVHLAANPGVLVNRISPLNGCSCTFNRRLSDGLIIALFGAAVATVSADKAQAVNSAAAIRYLFIYLCIPRLMLYPNEFSFPTHSIIHFRQIEHIRFLFGRVRILTMLAR